MKQLNLGAGVGVALFSLNTIILVGCGAAADDWNVAIAELLRDEFIETHADGNLWRAKP